MGSRGKNPHNALFVDTFADVEHASSFLAAILPSGITRHLALEGLALTSDHHVDEKLAELETDLLFTVPTRSGDEVLVYCLLEHQSTVDRWMAFRLLRYMVRIWDKWLREHDDAEALPPIVPVVLAHAPGGWTAPRDFVSLIAGPQELVASLRTHLPDFEAVVEDLAVRSDEDLAELKVTALSRLVLTLFKHSRDGDILERLPSWSRAFAEAYQGSGFEALVRVLMYIMEVVEGATLDHLEWVDREVDAPEGEVIMTLAEKLRQEGEQRGLEKGQQLLLLKLLKLRFGELTEETTSRVKASSLADLEAMAERVLTAKNLDEVFTNDT